METKLMLREAEARDRLGGMSRDVFFRLLRTGEIKSVHVGRALYIPATSLEEYVELLVSRSRAKRPDSTCLRTAPKQR